MLSQYISLYLGADVISLVSSNGSVATFHLKKNVNIQSGLNFVTVPIRLQRSHLSESIMSHGTLHQYFH
jgi:hypothetical protein